MNLRSLFPRGSEAFFSANAQAGSALSPAVPQCNTAPALVEKVKGAGQIRGRVRVRYTGCFVRPQDSDNLAGATKICSDLLRGVGLFPNDDPYSIELSWRQRKVKSFAEERLEIEITPTTVRVK